MKGRGLAVVVGATAALVAAQRSALAVPCSELPNPIYVTGSSAATPFLAEISKLLVNQSPPVDIVYTAQGSCAGVDAVLNGTPIVPSVAAPASYWDSLDNQQDCDLPSTGVTADLGISDVFASSCIQLPNGLPQTIADFLGPVQTMTFVVPKASKQLSISAEAAYYVYGFGNASGVAPWTDTDFIFQRSSDSGTESMIATAIGVPVARWQGVVTATSGDILQRVANSANPEATIGILSTSEAQDDLAALNILAYQHFDQKCGYYPDSLPTANDKRNVRDGHYALWGPLHMFSQIGTDGYPRKQPVRDIIGYVAGTKAVPSGVDMIYLQAQRHVIPQCAMQVTRSEEMGALASFAPAKACGCYYDELTTGQSRCAPCMVATDCASSTPACNYGFCETQ
jgi:ABC-type phosphate transport system substrate-binding protein